MLLKLFRQRIAIAGIRHVEQAALAAWDREERAAVIRAALLPLGAVGEQCECLVVAAVGGVHCDCHVSPPETGVSPAVRPTDPRRAASLPFNCALSHGSMQGFIDISLSYIAILF